MRNRNRFDWMDYTALSVLALCSILVLAVVAGLVAFAIVLPIKEYHHRVEHVGCVVNGKDRASDGSSSSMRVYTNNCGVFEVQDAAWIGHFDSANIYNEIVVGRTYDFETTGYRIPFLSDFPNIITVAPATA